PPHKRSLRKISQKKNRLRPATSKTRSPAWKCRAEGICNHHPRRSLEEKRSRPIPKTKDHEAHKNATPPKNANIPFEFPPRSAHHGFPDGNRHSFAPAPSPNRERA